MAKPKPAETVDETAGNARREMQKTPGLLVVLAAGRPAALACPVPKGGIVLGRDWLSQAGIEDDRASRTHLRATLGASGFSIEDLGSRNGTFIDGQRITGKVSLGASGVLRLGHTLLLPCDDLGAFARWPTRIDGDIVRGPRSAATLDRVVAATSAASLLLLGESGVGKEIYARAFHAHGRRAKGPFIAVNCAAVPVSLAERLFFGAKEGAYSGAKEAEGYVRAAHRGTLFLDELGELEPSLQPKLLRLLESHEVLPVGGARVEHVDVAICAATNRDLRSDVAAGRFREDLFYRLSEPSVEVPALRERRDEIPWFCAAAAHKLDPSVAIGARFVEACLLRPWPGNVREILAETARATRAAVAERQLALQPEHLAPNAGLALQRGDDDTPRGTSAVELPADATIEQALANVSGNVTAAARALGIHRMQLRRWLERRRS